MAGTSGRYAVGDSVTMADLAIVPQLYNARRYDTHIIPVQCGQRYYVWRSRILLLSLCLSASIPCGCAARPPLLALA